MARRTSIDAGPDLSQPSSKPVYGGFLSVAIKVQVASDLLGTGSRSNLSEAASWLTSATHCVTRCSSLHGFFLGGVLVFKPSRANHEMRHEGPSGTLAVSTWPAGRLAKETVSLSQGAPG